MRPETQVYSGDTVTPSISSGELSLGGISTEMQPFYDGDGNVTETITSERFNTDSTSATGALGTPTGGNKARIYYEGVRSLTCP